MFEYWQDAGARGKARSRSPKKSENYRNLKENQA